MSRTRKILKTPLGKEYGGYNTSQTIANLSWANPISVVEFIDKARSGVYNLGGLSKAAKNLYLDNLDNEVRPNYMLLGLCEAIVIMYGPLVNLNIPENNWDYAVAVGAALGIPSDQISQKRLDTGIDLVKSGQFRVFLSVDSVNLLDGDESISASFSN